MSPNILPQRAASKKLQRRSHRSNLGGSGVRRRGESNFVLAFERAYLREMHPELRLGKGYREVPVTGYGVADLVWISWTSQNEGNALKGEKIQTSEAVLTAFEMKLKDWAGGLAQAARYRFFAHRSYLVLPESQIELALKKRETFLSAGVGLISFDSPTGQIRVAIESVMGTPLSRKAFQSAADRMRLLRTIKVGS